MIYILRPNRDQLRKMQLQGLRLGIEPATLKSSRLVASLYVGIGKQSFNILILFVQIH